MARERKRAGGLALVQARQSRLTAARERQRAAKSRRGFELTSKPQPWWQRRRTLGRK